MKSRIFITLTIFLILFVFIFIKYSKASDPAGKIANKINTNVKNSIGNKISSKINNKKYSCDKPITYKLGSVDERFGLDEDEALIYTKEAADIWNKGLNKNVFVYDEEAGKIKISFIFDKRQSETIDRNKKELETKIKSEEAKTKLENINKKGVEFDNLKNSFESENKIFEAILKEYNQKIERVNSVGGADPYTFSLLEAEKLELDKKIKTLKEKEADLQKLSANINNEVNNYNNFISNLNKSINIFNKNLSTQNKQFEQGVYIEDRKGKRINIFQYENPDVLKRLLAHELGHALGIDHITNEKSIMYYLNNSTSTALLKEDIEAYKAVCK